MARFYRTLQSRDRRGRKETENLVPVAILWIKCVLGGKEKKRPVTVNLDSSLARREERNQISRTAILFSLCRDKNPQNGNRGNRKGRSRSIKPRKR